MAEPKEKPGSSLRSPKPKKTLGLSVPTALRLPHDDLIKPEQNTMPSQTTQTRHSRQGIAPERDFARVPNSLTREVIPAGEFKGKSKQLYDCLYSMTRGAIQPARSVRISRPRLMKKAGIGARVTFEANIAHLIAVGLLQVRQIAGEHEGNEYIVFLPEERSMPNSMPSQSSQTRHAQDQDRPVSLESSQTRHTLSVDNADTSAAPKTSFKTSEKNLDDEAALAKLRALERELTGKNSGTAAQWEELFDVLCAELRIAATRTTVSSAPSFLAEHLRRRLWKMDKKQATREGKELPDQMPVEAKASPVDCPDCNGTGWWYPNGTENGVAKCKHSRLK